MQLALFPENARVESLDANENKQEHTRGTLAPTYGLQEDPKGRAAGKWPASPSRSSAWRSLRSLFERCVPRGKPSRCALGVAEVRVSLGKGEARRTHLYSLLSDASVTTCRRSPR